MPRAKKQEVATVEESDGALVEMEAPSFLTEGSAGKEGLSFDDIEFPQLKLLQGTTPGLNENGWRTGNFLHSILEEQVDGHNDEGILVTPLVRVPKRYRLFNPIDQGGGILARADDGVHWTPPDHEFRIKINKGTKEVTYRTAKTVKASGLGEWGSSDPDDPNSPPAADVQYVYICNSPSHPHFGAFTILLQRSGVSTARRWNSLISASPYNCYDRVFRFTSFWKDEGPDNKKFVWVVRPAGFVPTNEQSEQNRKLNATLSEASFSVHDEQAEVVSDGSSNNPVIDGEATYDDI